MESKNKKNSKKDKLEGAIGNELGSDGIMSAFVSQIQSDKSEPVSQASPEMKESEKFHKNEDERRESMPTRRLAMIKSPGKKEWWISLGAFSTIIILVLFFFWLPCSKAQTYKIRLSDKSMDAISMMNLPDTANFSVGSPVYFFFGSEKPLQVKKVFIHVENLNLPSSTAKMSSTEYNINPNWKSIETHFQKEFFDSPGKYRITVENAEKKVLAEKIFYIR